MPPETSEVSIPKGRGRDSKEWMEYHGYVATTPSIRSSDYEGVLHCPFQYYLSRRLGLSPALRWSKALSRGSWFHKRLELYREEGWVASQHMEAQLQDRLEELREICKARGIKGSSRDEILDREKKDFKCALGWYDAAMELSFGDRQVSLLSFISQPHFRNLGSEVGVRLHMPQIAPTERVMLTAMYDILLYHEVQNTIFIVDAKTCSESPVDRLSTCPLEFQTQHYMMVLKYALEANLLQPLYNLPEDVRVGGMIHMAIQKPTIEFGMKDRDYEEKEHTLTRGPRKGQVEMRRTYMGEPRFENYLERCKNWYRATGEYEHLAPKWSSSPPVNISLTYGSTLLDQDYLDEYLSRVSVIRHYAKCHPIPKNFPRSASHLRQFGKLSPFAPFYLVHPREWPGIIEREGFIQLDRDEDVDFKIDASYAAR